MAFIRNYAARDMGDPFSLRIPKKLRKLKVGRALGKVARAGLSLVPGIGGIASSLLPPEAQAAQAEAAMLPPAGEPEWDDENPGAGFTYIKPPPGHPAWSFARSYGWDMGDPGVRVPKRKQAAAGPKAKAARKAEKRAAKAAAPARGMVKATSARGKKAGAFGGMLGAFGASALEAARQTGKIARGGPGSIMSQAFNFSMPGSGATGARGAGVHRRAMNPTNVKALRRSLRRLEGFEKLVKRIEKQYPRLKRPAGAARAVPRGHKSGCRCVACK